MKRKTISPTYLHEKKRFKHKVRRWAVRLKVHPSQIRIQKMRKKWASCSPGKWLCFNERILKKDAAFQRYVIVHELLHLRIRNHGGLFKSLLSIHAPKGPPLSIVRGIDKSV